MRHIIVIYMYMENGSICPFMSPEILIISLVSVCLAITYMNVYKTGFIFYVLCGRTHIYYHSHIEGVTFVLII